MSDHVFERVARLMLAGASVDEAIGVTFRSRPDDRVLIRRLVPFDGNPTGIPSAPCVRKQLAGIETPTREQIIAALRVCSGG